MTEKRNILSLDFLTISCKPTTYSATKHIHRKSYWNAWNKIFFLFFFYKVFFSFDSIINIVTSQVRSRTESDPKASLVIPRLLKMADP